MTKWHITKIKTFFVNNKYAAGGVVVWGRGGVHEVCVWVGISHMANVCMYVCMLCCRVYSCFWGEYLCMCVCVCVNSLELTSCCDGAPQRRLFAACDTIQTPIHVAPYCRPDRGHDVQVYGVVDYLRRKRNNQGFSN